MCQETPCENQGGRLKFTSRQPSWGVICAVEVSCPRGTSILYALRKECERMAVSQACAFHCRIAPTYAIVHHESLADSVAKNTRRAMAADVDPCARRHSLLRLPVQSHLILTALHMA